MRKLLLTAIMMVVAVTVSAVPAKPGTKRKVVLADGTTVQLTLHGDEHFSYYTDAQDKPCLLKAKASGALLSATNVTVEATPAETEIYKLLGVGSVGDGKAYIYGTMRYMDDDTPHSASSANIYIMQGKKFIVQ